jgi:diacylglycerol kinase
LHFKVHSAAAITVIAMGLALNVSTIEWAILVLTIGFVFAAEYANSALERLGDRVSTEYDPLIRDAKDFAAASVLIAAIAAAVVGLLILGPKLWSYLVEL